MTVFGILPTKIKKCILFVIYFFLSDSIVMASQVIEPLKQCVISKTQSAVMMERCLQFQATNEGLCGGSYLTPARSMAPKGGYDLDGDAVMYTPTLITFKGHVKVNDDEKQITANAAYIYRDSQTNQLTKIVLLNHIMFQSDDAMVFTEKALFYPKTKQGYLSPSLYHLQKIPNYANLPPWGYADNITLKEDNTIHMNHVSYSTCRPTDNAWQMVANALDIDNKTHTGKAKHVTLRLKGVPIFYSPYMSFATAKGRHSGFLWPVVGLTDTGGIDIGLPYYLNLAPNYDATLTPHLYSRRGMMIGTQFRYLFPYGTGDVRMNYLPNDRVYRDFLNTNKVEFPQLNTKSADRFSFGLTHYSRLSPKLRIDALIQTVSDDNYFQDFSTNMAITTDRQLPRQLSMTYEDNHWFAKAMVQSYQTLNPINLAPITPAFARLPSLIAKGFETLPFGMDATVLTSFDSFQGSSLNTGLPEGDRFHVNPRLSRPINFEYGYVTPTVEWLGSAYTFSSLSQLPHRSANRQWIRGSIDSGLTFEKANLNSRYYETIEPRLYYLFSPFVEQSHLPIYDSSLMIFTTDQLFRSNRFSGIDRIGDANQLSYAMTYRDYDTFLGYEKWQVTIGQTRFFSKRRVGLCFDSSGTPCIEPDTLVGSLPNDTDFSPVAGLVQFHFDSHWSSLAGIAYDPFSDFLQNGQFLFQYVKNERASVQAGITFLDNGDVTPSAFNKIENDALYQGVLSYSYPMSEHWSTLGVFNYNISKGYQMLSLLGLEYDSCCWAVRLIGGQSFNELDVNGKPGYNNHVFLQLLLKGMGSVASADPSSTLHTFLPYYRDRFH